MSGWIKLHRSLLKWEWWDDHNTTRLLIYLLVAVNYEQKKWRGMIINKGQLFTSWEHLSNETGLSVKQLRNSTKKLEDCKEVVRKGQANGQLITLVKWDKLQEDEKQGASKRASEGQARGKRGASKRATTKEDKEIEELKEDNNILPEISISGVIPSSEKFDFKKSLIELGVEDQVASDWMEVRKKKKAANTLTAFKTIKNEIEKSGLTANECIARAAGGSWAGFKAEWVKINNQNNGTITRKQTVDDILRDQIKGVSDRLDREISEQGN